MHTQEKSLQIEIEYVLLVAFFLHLSCCGNIVALSSVVNFCSLKFMSRPKAMVGVCN